MQTGWTYTAVNDDGTKREHKWQCETCDGRWKSKKGGSRAVKVMLPSRNKKAEPFMAFMVLDAPPPDLWETHVKRRIEYYQKFEGQDPLRDKMPTFAESTHYAQRLRVEGEASNAMWRALIGPDSEENVSKFQEIMARLRG